MSYQQQGYEQYNQQPPQQQGPPQQDGQQQQQPMPATNGEGNAGGDQRTTLWMGELEAWMDENFIRSIFGSVGEAVSVKMIRDKFNGTNAGYCFVDFPTSEAAARGLQYNGQLIPNSQRPFKLNWASGGGLAERGAREDRPVEHSIFVGDLGPEVTEYVLCQLFQNRYASCKSAKIMTDPNTGSSRGYGFVRFADEEESKAALTEMQGVYAGNRPMRISSATPKTHAQGGRANNGMMQGMAQHGGMGGPGMYPPVMGGPNMGFYGSPQPINQFTDPNNTTVFVGGLSGYVSEDELRSFFQGFGEITYVKIPPGKGCGFVQFVQRHAAEMAINQMQGYPIGNSRVRLSWGRSQNQTGPNQGPYRGAQQPPMYPSMGMPPQHPYGSYGPPKVFQ